MLLGALLHIIALFLIFPRQWNCQTSIPLPANNESTFISFFDHDATAPKVYHLKKTRFNDKIRILLIAGLEGTGHHAFSAMFSVCEKKNLCEVERTISELTMNFTGGRQNLVHGLFGAVDAGLSFEISVATKSALKEVAKKKGEHLYFLGLERVSNSGMFSYPNFGGKLKPLDHPDLYQFALLAEEAGVDFRVIVLQRNGYDILKSVERRYFGNEEPKIMIDNAAALYTQLSLVDPHFYYCLQYEDLIKLKLPSAERERERLSSFLHPTNLNKDIIFEMVKKVGDPKHESVSESEKNEKRIHSSYNSSLEYMATLLNARQSFISELCMHQRKQMLSLNL